jgi:rubrerythrin
MSEASGCTGKERFETRGRAESVRKRMMRSRRRGPHMRVYRCEYCGGWHIGTSFERKHRRQK